MPHRNIKRVQQVTDQVTGDIKVSIRNLYKIFGPDPDTALQHVSNGMSKTDLLNEHGHVLGLRDINVDVRAGNITVVMGLSGSGKCGLAGS